MKLFRRRKTEPQDMLGPNTATQSRSLGSFAMGGSLAGVFVNEEQALMVSAVYSAVRILSEDIASLPLHLYDDSRDARRRAVWRPEYRLLNSAPNTYQSAYDLREAMTASVLLWGNAFAEIERNAQGAPIGLHFIEPARVRIKLVPGERRYEYHVDGTQALTADQVLHLKAFSTDGMNGRSIIAQARESIGLTAATERYGSAYFGNGATPGGVLETEKRITDPVAVERLRDSWNARHQGPHKAGGVAILEDGMKYRQIGLPPEDSQFLETRRFQVSEIARWFRIPPHMLSDLEHATFSNIEHQGIDYVKHTLRPWLVRFEQAYRRQLIPDALRDVLYFEHNADALMRGDITSRYQAYSVGRQWGWLSANDVRRKENMNPIPDGDEYLVPLNMRGGSDEG